LHVPAHNDAQKPLARLVHLQERVMESTAQLEIAELRAERILRLWLIGLYVVGIGATLTIATIVAHWLHPLAQAN